MRYWRIDGTFLARRAHFEARFAQRRGAEAGEIYAGLAVGYLDVGLKSDAVLAAALSIVESPSLDANCCRGPLDVLLDCRLFRLELADDLRRRLAQRGS